MFHQRGAFVTVLFELGLAVGADHPVIFYAAFATGAKELIFDGGEEGFFFEGALIFVFQSARGA